MSTLNDPRVAAVLTQLFADAQAADAPMRARLAALPPAARADLLAGAHHDYRSFYGQAREMYLPVSPETGKLLYLLARTSNARTIVEFGTSFGISTIHLAAALKDNGGGCLIGSELEPSKVERARANLTAAGLSSLVELRVGDAAETLARDLPDTIDLLLLDGAKVLYPRVLALLEPRLRSGALVVADNAEDSPEFLAIVRGGGAWVSVPFGDDVEVALRG